MEERYFPLNYPQGVWYFWLKPEGIAQLDDRLKKVLVQDLGLPPVIPLDDAYAEQAEAILPVEVVAKIGFAKFNQKGLKPYQNENGGVHVLVTGNYGTKVEFTISATGQSVADIRKALKEAQFA